MKKKILAILLSVCLFISTTAGMTTVAGADEHVHNLVYSYEASTCITNGHIGVWYCAECNSRYTDAEATNKVFTRDIMLPLDPDNHFGEPTLKESEAATCTTDGYDQYYCMYCATTYTEVVYATGHSWDEGIVTKAATCTEAGEMTYTCTVCGETKTEAIAATGNHTYDAGTVTQEATCTEAGVMTYTCTVCGDSYTEEISATGHSWGETVYSFSEDGSACTATRTCENDSSHVETATATIASAQTLAPTCTIKGETTYTATFTEDWAETQTLTVADVDATGHTVVTDEAVAATCTETGLTEGSHCSVCQEVLVAQEVVAATGHSWGETVYSFSEDGSACTATRTCENDSSHVETATATITSEQTSDPDCTTKGETTYTATFTEEWAETQTLTVADVDATGHTLTHTEAVDAGCATEGNIEYWYCSVCQKYFSDEDCTTEVTLEETVTAATDNHTYKAIVTDPTCTEKGYTTYICTECGDNYRDDYTDPAGHTAGTPVKENYVPVTATKDGYYELATYCTVCGEEISRSYTTIAAYGTNFRETIDWTAVFNAYANKTTTTVTIEEITITEPVEPGDTETEVDSGDEVTSEPTVETEAPETNPTTGMVMALLPMAMALAGIGITKKK